MLVVSMGEKRKRWRRW